MSALQVGPGTIDRILAAALAIDNLDHHGPLTWTTRNADGTATVRTLDPSNVDTVGAMLLAENYASVNTRYHTTDQPPPYRYQQQGSGPDRGLTIGPIDITRPDTVIDAASWYEYQSCEHDGWEPSEAAAFIDALIGRCQTLAARSANLPATSS